MGVGEIENTEAVVDDLERILGDLKADSDPETLSRLEQELGKLSESNEGAD